MSAESVWIQREQDLENRLVTALQTNEPARFRFLLASLSPHAVDWFDTRQQATDTSWTPPFSVGVKRPFYATNRDHERTPAQSVKRSMVEWRLLDALDPEAMVFLDEHDRVPAQVLDNAPVWVHARQQARKDSEAHPEDLIDILDSLYRTNSNPNGLQNTETGVSS